MDKFTGKMSPKTKQTKHNILPLENIHQCLVCGKKQKHCVCAGHVSFGQLE